MKNKITSKKIISIFISILFIATSNKVIFANNENIVKIDKNLELYVSGASMLIYGELANPLTEGSVNEELKDIPKDSILKAIRYKDPDTKNIITIENVESIEEISNLYKYPDNMKIHILIIQKGRLREVITDILTLRNQQWTIDMGAGGTMSFITPDKKHFGILAHEFSKDIKFKNIKVYTTKDAYINKNGNTLRGYTKDKYIGYITHSCDEGSFGIVEDFDSIPIKGKYKISPLEEVKKEKSYVMSQSPKTQEVESIKIDVVRKKGLPAINKIYSIVYKLDKGSITSVRNGIGPGYSGSPIMQDGRIIGATSIKYNFSHFNKIIAYPLSYFEKYTGGVDIYKYLYRLNNLEEKYNIIKN